MEWRPYPFLTFNKTAAWGWYILVCLCQFPPSRQEGFEDLWWLFVNSTTTIREYPNVSLIYESLRKWTVSTFTNGTAGALWEEQPISSRRSSVQSSSSPWNYDLKADSLISDVSRSYAGSLPLQRLMNRAGFRVLACCFCSTNHNELRVWPQLQQSKYKRWGIEDFFQRRRAWNTTSSAKYCSDQWFYEAVWKRTKTSFPSNNGSAACRSWRKSEYRIIMHAWRKAALYSPFAFRCPLP